VGLRSPRLEAEVLAANLLDCSRAGLLSRWDETAPPDLVAALEGAVSRRIAGEPLQYIVGRAGFRSLQFHVDRRVLIPRPETELLVETCLARVRAARPAIVDVGTGSGCVVVAVARERPDARLTAVDIDPGALAVARDNAARLVPDVRIRWLRGDLLEPLREGALLDAIVSNPPYVAAGEIGALQPEVRDHEPRGALVAGETGLEVVDRLIPAAAGRLRDGGRLLLEIGAGQWRPVRERLRSARDWEEPEVREDFQGIPRVVCAARRPR
jgi:release factor glutamine methyltransferase